MKATRSSGNVFRDIGFSEEESANLEARSRLMIVLEKEIRRLKLTQSQVAKMLGVKPPRISELMNGRIEKFSLDLLVLYLSRLGKTVEFHVIKKAA
jgi:predicted XRE-type DNA-binding protein